MAESPPAKRRKLDDGTSLPAVDTDQQRAALLRQCQALSSLALLVGKHESDMRKDQWKNAFYDVLKELALGGSRMSGSLAGQFLHQKDSSEVITSSDLDSLQRQISPVYVELNKVLQWWSDYWQKYTRQASAAFVAFLRSLSGALCAVALQSHLSSNTFQLMIPGKELDSMLRLYSEASFVEQCGQLVANGLLRFPFKRYFMPPPLALFGNLQRYQPTEDSSRFELPGIRFNTGGFFPFTFRGQFLTYTASQYDYDAMDIITDYFQEDERLNARRKDERQSPLEAWTTPSRQEAIFRRAVARCKGNKDFNTYEMREAVYETVKVRQLPAVQERLLTALVQECSTFKCTLVCAVIRKLQARRYLDISAGWGDRLIGALASGIDRYIATDPNVRLKAGHDAILATLADEAQRSQFQIMYEPFQTAALPNEQFDLVFSSPPYFDFEIYTTDVPGQSVAEFPLFENWLVMFLLTSIKKAWNLLAINGCLAIHITDTRGAACCEAMNLFLEAKFTDSVYLGVIASRGATDKPRPTWVWQKLASLTAGQTERKSVAEQHARRHFSSLWNKISSQLL